MRRFGLRDITLYILLALMIFFTFTSLQQMDRRDAPTYSQIRTLFLQEQVEYFTLEDSTLTLTLRGQNGGEPVRLTYRVADPDLFYYDMRELVNEQLKSGVLKGYDYPPGVESSWWFNLIPYVVAAAVLCLFWYLMMRQRGAASGGGSSPGAARFSHARTRTLSDQGKKVTFDDVAGADEEKEELREIVEFLRDPQKFTALGARIPKGVI